MLASIPPPTRTSQYRGPVQVPYGHGDRPSHSFAVEQLLAALDLTGLQTTAG